MTSAAEALRRLRGEVVRVSIQPSPRCRPAQRSNAPGHLTSTGRSLTFAVGVGFVTETDRMTGRS